MSEVSELKAKIGVEGVPETTAGLKGVGEGMRKLGEEAKGAAGKLAETQTAWGRFKSDFTSGFNFSAGLSAFNMLRDGLSNVASMAMDAATEYESAMNILEASSNANEETMAAFGDTARALGADLTLPATSAGGAAQAMLELSKAGLTAEESMAAAKGTIQLAATEMMSEARAAQITAGAMNAFSLKGAEATRVADLLAAGSNASAASVGGLATGLQQLSASFASNNQSLDTAVTSLAALSNVGYSASDAGTALNNMMMRLAAPTAEAANVMEQLRFNAYDAQGTMKPLEQIIDELGAATANMTDEQRNAALSTILMTDGMKAMNPLLSLGSQGFTDLRGKVQEQGAAAKLAEAQTKGFRGAMEGLKSAVETLAVEGLTPLLPLMSGAIRIFAQLLGPVGAVASFIGGNFVPVLAGASAALLAYTIQTNAAAIASAGGLIPALAKLALGFKATALSAAAAIIPLAVMAIAVAGPIIALNHLTDVASEQSKAILKNRDAYNDAKTSLQNYANAASTLQGNPALESETQKLKELTALYEEKFKRATGDGTGNWLKAGMDSADVTARQVAELEQLEQQMAAVRTEMEKQKTVAMFDSKALDGAVTSFNAMEAAADGYGVTAQDAFVVTEEAAKKAQQELERLASAGPGAYDALIASASNFQTVRETAQATHLAKMAELRRNGTPAQIAAEEEAYRAQEQTAASSYVAQQAAQRVHLGQMLIDWINAQAMTNADFAAKSGELVTMIAGQYGMVASAGDVVWGSNLNAIRGYVDGAIPTLDALSSTMAANTEQAIDNHTAAEKLEAKYTTEIEQKWAAGAYGVGPEAVEAYRRDLDSVPVKVQTEIAADAANAVAQAEKAQDQYARMERKIESEIVANPADALLAANDVRNEYERIPREVTTNVSLTGQSAATAAAAQLGRDILSGVAAGVTANGFMLSSALQKTAASAMAAAKGYLQIASPSRRAAEEIGKPLVQGAAKGVEEGEKLVGDALKKAVGDVASAYRSFASRQEDLNRDHAGKLKGIWEDYYADLKAQTEQFNGSKFDEQLDFYDSIENLDAASRQRALEEQRTAWDVSQEMAQEGRAAEAAAYYERAMEIIEADEARAAKQTAIAQDIADQKRAIAEASTDEERAIAEAELAELESRQQYLQEVDAQRDARDAEELERLRTQESATAAVRDEALADENSDYKDAQEKLATDFGTAVDAILGHEDRMLGAHIDFANALIGSYEGAADAARRAMASLPTSGGGEGETPEGEPATEGSYASGKEMIPNTPKGYSVVTVHPGEGILTPDENQMWLAIKRGMSTSGGSIPQAAPAQAAGERPIIIQGPLIGEAHLHNDLDVEVVTNQILKRLRQARS